MQAESSIAVDDLSIEQIIKKIIKKWSKVMPNNIALTSHMTSLR